MSAQTDVLREVRYGPSWGQLLDVFGAKVGEARPVALFIGGSSFFEAEPLEAAEFLPLFEYLASKGMVILHVGCRRGGAAVYPSGVMDVAAAIDWLKGHAKEIGADPMELSLMGQAVGATHAAGYAYDARTHVFSTELRRLVLFDPKLALEPINSRDEILAYYGSTELTRLLNPANFVSRTSVPTLAVISGSPTPAMGLAELTDAVKEKPDLLTIFQRQNGSSALPGQDDGSEQLRERLAAFLGLEPKAMHFTLANVDHFLKLGYVDWLGGGFFLID